MNNKKISLMTGKAIMFEQNCKHLFLFLMSLSALSLSACTTNPATGEQQFTAFMPAGQEASLGMQEHKKVMQLYGEAYKGSDIEAYVNKVGQRVIQSTERNDVKYKFFVLDTPVVNAFAVPGGYIYVSRGLLALANSEAELAAVLAHETGHITARHSAERYSHGVLASLGAAAVAATLDKPGVGRAAGLGSNLYIKAYSRSQEHQADHLGLRYLVNAGYDPRAMGMFLTDLEQHSLFEDHLKGVQPGKSFSYFSTHPQTDDRIERVVEEAMQEYAGRPGVYHKEEYLKAIDGLVYGDSPKQGFVRGQDFYHPKIGFTFSVPQGYRIINNPKEIIAVSKDGSMVLFDMAKTSQALDPMAYLQHVWMRNERLDQVEKIEINGMRAVTGSFDGKLNGKAVTIRVIAIEWGPGHYFRMQMAIPQIASKTVIEGLKSVTYSFRRMTDQEKKVIKPYSLKIMKAVEGNTVKYFANYMAYDNLKETRFRILNGLKPDDPVLPGHQYKVVVQ
jgi:predicted Zn-dependent protease